VVKQQKACRFLTLLLILTARLEAQEYNSVPLDHVAYDIITMGVIQGIILPPPAAKPWPLHTVKQKLWEIIEYPGQILSVEEEETVIRALDSFDRKRGLDLMNGRYRAEGSSAAFEAGIGWESDFAVEAPGGLLNSVNLMKLYTGGGIADFVSWNITALGEFLYIERNEQGQIPTAFPYTFGKQWEGGVLSLRNPDADACWPDDPSLAYGLEAELNGAFFDRHLLLRLGRIRHDWGQGENGASLFLNARSRPFTAFEGNFLPLSWLNISFLGGALEPPDDGPFSNVLAAAQIDLNPLMYVHFGIGGAAVLLNQPNAAFLFDLEFRLPGMFSMWGKLFVDRLNSSSGDFFSTNGNNYAYQGGIKIILQWLPLAAFTLRYTKIEPYCYGGEWGDRSSAFTNGGEPLGYYLPPNSDELLIRFESLLFPDIKGHIQFQMIRHGVDYGYGAVGGSSLYDNPDNGNSAKYFLKDGVYRWDNVIKLGATCNFKSQGVPISVFAETGLAVTNYTINGNAGVGRKANYEPLNDPVYQAVNNTNFIFSIGFRLFP
jgi:hypothetical protein